MQTNFSLHQIQTSQEFSFCVEDYSRFKFGDGVIAQKFGIALAKGFIKAHLADNLPSKQMVVVSSPYSFIPTATFAMKTHFVYELNNWLATHNLPVLQETKIHRTITYKEDYGELNAEERMKLIGNDQFHIDKAFLYNKNIIFLDDIRITGSHERMIKKMLTEYELTNDCYLLYFAELTNKTIHPNIENYINYSAVKSIFDLNDIIKKVGFCINTRIVKYLLNADQNSFIVFTQNQDIGFIHILYNMAIGNGYHTIETYQPNLKVLKEQIFQTSAKIDMAL